MRRPIKTLFACVAFIVACLAVYIFWDGNGSKPLLHACAGEVNRNCVRFRMKDADNEVSFAVPKAYLRSDYCNSANRFLDNALQAKESASTSDCAENASRDSVIFNAVISSRQPLSATGIGADNSDAMLVALFSHAKGNISQLLERNVREKWTAIPSSMKGFAEYIYSRELSYYESKSRIVDEYFVPEALEEHSTYFRCVREYVSKNAGCIGFITLGNSLELDYSFRRSELSRWRDFQAAAKEIVEAFERAPS